MVAGLKLAATLPQFALVKPVDERALVANVARIPGFDDVALNGGCSKRRKKAKAEAAQGVRLVPEPGHGVVPNEFQIPRTPDAEVPDWLANAATEYANGGREPRDIAPARPIRRAVLITVSDQS
jgi:hypothetical protein